MLNLEALGEASFIPEGLSEKVDVKPLLDGVELEQSRRERRDREERFVSRPTPPPEPAKDVEAVAELAKIKTNLDLKAQKYAKRCLWLYVGVLAAMWTGLAILTRKFGWDTMEPWTYFIGVGGTFISYAYFAVTQRQFSPKAIYDHIVDSKKRKNYQTSGFDLEKYEGLTK